MHTGSLLSTFYIKSPLVDLLCVLRLKSAKTVLTLAKPEKFTVCLMFVQAIRKRAVFTDVSGVVEEDQGEISTSESILTTE